VATCVPTIAFGGLLQSTTRDQLGLSETMLAQSVVGMFMAVTVVLLIVSHCASFDLCFFFSEIHSCLEAMHWLFYVLLVQSLRSCKRCAFFLFRLLQYVFPLTLYYSGLVAAQSISLDVDFLSNSKSHQ
jgi:hypothetical protein